MNFNLPDIDKTNQDKLSGLLGIKMVELTKTRVVATMPVDHRHHQPMGLLHGGASITLAETVASTAGWFQVAEEGKVVVGQEINANHLRQVRSGLLTAIGTPLHLGNTSQVWDIKIYDENQNLVCISRCTLAVIVPR